jgi:K+-sensing histidine kinase KdpD
VAVLAPLLLAGILELIHYSNPRDYIFLYLGIVAALGVASGVWPAYVAAAVSFLVVDYLFVRPVHTLSIASTDDVVNLLVFFGAATVVGSVGSRRRAAQLRAEALAAELQDANLELGRLNEEQAEAARVALQLARTEQQVTVLEETDRLRTELLANVSHELRTPLATILVTSTRLLDQAALAEHMRDDVGIVAAQARRLRRLVSDMLDMTRITGRAIDLHPADVDLGDALTAARDRLRVQSPSREVDVDITPGTPEVVADWDRLGQVLDNLLANADRHAPAVAPISVRAMATGDDRVEIHVVDGGPGVPDALRDRVFERFVRGTGPADREVGTGLGLAIVRGLVDAQGGAVRLEPAAPGEGAHFTIMLPAAGRA